MSDVFISYKAEDRSRVRPLVEALEADGLSVWWDAHIGGGDEWRETIARHLDNARCVIVVWSKRSVGPEVDTFLDPIRADPRFDEIVAKLNFPPS